MRFRLGESVNGLPDLLSRTFSNASEEGGGLGGARGFTRSIKAPIVEKRLAAVVGSTTTPPPLPGGSPSTGKGKQVN